MAYLFGWRESDLTNPVEGAIGQNPDQLRVYGPDSTYFVVDQDCIAERVYIKFSDGSSARVYLYDMDTGDFITSTDEVTVDDIAGAGTYIDFAPAKLTQGQRVGIGVHGSWYTYMYGVDDFSIDRVDWDREFNYGPSTTKGSGGGTDGPFIAWVDGTTTVYDTPAITHVNDTNAVDQGAIIDIGVENFTSPITSVEFGGTEALQIIDADPTDGTTTIQVPTNLTGGVEYAVRVSNDSESAIVAGISHTQIYTIQAYIGAVDKNSIYYGQGFGSDIGHEINIFHTNPEPMELVKIPDGNGGYENATPGTFATFKEQGATWADVDLHEDINSYMNFPQEGVYEQTFGVLYDDGTTGTWKTEVTVGEGVDDGSSNPGSGSDSDNDEAWDTSQHGRLTAPVSLNISN